MKIIKEIVVKVFWSLVTLVIALIPSWLYLVARIMLRPQGFWQNLVLGGIAFHLLGALQIILLIVGLVIIVLILFDWDWD